MAEENIPDPLEADNQGRPEWLPEKFKSPEDLAKSYGELESRLGELSERAKQADALESNYVELATRLEQVEAQRAQQVGNDAATPLIAEFENAMETGNYKAALSVQAQISQMAAQAAVSAALPSVEKRYQTLEESQANEIGVYASNRLEQKYGESFDQARNAMGELLQANPYLIPESAKYDPNAAVAALENVYRLATYGQAVEEKTISTNDLDKQRAQTATGAGTRVLTPDEVKQEWDAIKNAAPRTYYS